MKLARELVRKVLVRSCADGTLKITPTYAGVTTEGIPGVVTRMTLADEIAAYLNTAITQGEAAVKVEYVAPPSKVCSRSIAVPADCQIRHCVLTNTCQYAQ